MSSDTDKKAMNGRQQAIVELIRTSGSVTIEQLEQHFDVTPQTLRRDLNFLAETNQILRFHGGATSISNNRNTPYTERKIQNLEGKQRIAEAVAAKIPDHCSLFINIGTTNEAVAAALMQHQGLQIITNSLHVATVMSQKEDFRVIVASGEVRARDGGIIGEATIDFIRQFRLDFGIVGISGIDDDGMLLDYDYREVRVAQAILDQSRCVYLAADHSKFGRNAMVQLAPIAAVDALFTDEAPPPALAATLKAEEIELHIA
ncbi:DeoR/GlpR family transcriptional regulator [Allohahella sp. A8]|uniref:DeoR/GlpR family transcriptional regulator n=1 Tax=Allohahella sp. A8 TaxID=3141461 RepID=UPI000C0AE75D|nr:DeoR/GlpR family transcriptional regulator [Hahellaceae bacterium]|tara:strand:- start:74106 stop:74885 length:780 start_codon:yes stop_codon:yes gene_type:complete